MEEVLRDLTTALENVNMEPNAGKQQVLGVTRSARDAWEARRGTAVAVAKDLGIHHYAYGHAHPELSKRIDSLREPTRRISSTKGTQSMASIPSEKCLYGAECHYITERQFRGLHRVMCTAMGDKEGRRPDAVRLLVFGAGKWDPEVARAKRLVKHWQKEGPHYAIPDDYLGLPGRHTGQLGANCLDAAHAGNTNLGRKYLGQLGHRGPGDRTEQRSQRSDGSRECGHSQQVAQARQTQSGPPRPPRREG